MPAISSIIAAIGVAASAAGSVMSYEAQSNAAAQNAAIAKQQENTRQTQMNLDAMRRKRDIIRQAQLASAASSATANSQGAGESSGMLGAQAGISGRSGTNILGVDQNQELGNKMFDLDRQQADVIANSSSATALGNGLSTLGNGMVRNSGTIGKIGQYLTTKLVD